MPESKKSYCFQCSSEYSSKISKCPECGVDTVPYAPSDIKSVSDKVQITYDFHEWSLESRSMMEKLLTGENLMHAWQGATLYVNEKDEQRVDEVVEIVEKASKPILDPKAEKTSYDITEFNDAQLNQVAEALNQAGLPNEITSEGELSILTSDEERADVIFDEISSRPQETVSFGSISEGIDIPSLLLGIRHFAESLQKEDLSGVKDGYEDLGFLFELALPFGFAAEDWQDILAPAEDLMKFLEKDEETDMEVLAEKSEKLIKVLAPYG